MRKKVCVLLMSFILLAIATSVGFLQDESPDTNNQYPDKPINIIVPFKAGGAMDLVAHLVQAESSKLNHPMIILNKPGASGVIGWNQLVEAQPDGYTIGISSTEIFLNPLYYSDSKYDYPTTLDPINQIATAPLLLVVKADQPWKNIADLVEYAKKHPGELKYSHSGIGTQNHILGETLSKMANIDIKQVPFQSAAEAMTAVLGGNVQIAIVNPGNAKAFVKNGDVKVLAVAGGKRMVDPTFANIPTFKEQGFDIVFTGRFGIAAPKDIPIEKKKELEKYLDSIITTPEFKKNIESMGLEYDYLNTEDAQKKWLSDNQKLRQAVYDTGILNQILKEK